MTEQTFINCTNGGPIRVHVKEGKIIRVRPLVFDKTDAPSWTLEAQGKKFQPFRKACVSPFVMAERLRNYSQNRIKWPMKRADFDPNGERHPETRGKSRYVRISWEEALDLVTSEIRRIQSTYGKAAITSNPSSHQNWGNVGYYHNIWVRFFDFLGFTQIFQNPDSWEGWHWGAMHHYGFHWRMGLTEQYDLLEDAMKNTELIVNWSSDPDSTRGGYLAQESTIWRLWLKRAGKKDGIH